VPGWSTPCSVRTVAVPGAKVPATCGLAPRQAVGRRLAGSAQAPQAAPRQAQGIKSPTCDFTLATHFGVALLFATPVIRGTTRPGDHGRAFTRCRWSLVTFRLHHGSYIPLSRLTASYLPTVGAFVLIRTSHKPTLPADPKWL